MQSAYLNSPHFKDIYLAVSMNKMPSKARTARKLGSRSFACGVYDTWRIAL